MRLQKFLSQAGVCSRRKGEEFIQAGRIKINGKTVTTLGTGVDPERDRIEFDGSRIRLKEKPIYIALNKPKDYVTSCNQKEAKIVLDLIPISQRIYPIGRLDKDSTGLLLLTNDGALHQRLSHPSFDHEKEYDVTVAMPIQDGALRKLTKGVSLTGRKTRPAEVKRISANRFRIILREGRNRQIRRMVAKIGNEVIALQRVRISGVKLGDLAEGAWRYLAENEINELLDASSKFSDRPEAMTG